MVLGIGDEFQRRGLAIFCPSRAAAEIEGSKAFAREFMSRLAEGVTRVRLTPREMAKYPSTKVALRAR